MQARQIVGWNVTQILVKRMLSIEELASCSDEDVSYLAHIEYGAVDSSVDVFERPAKALKFEL